MVLSALCSAISFKDKIERSPHITCPKKSRRPGVTDSGKDTSGESWRFMNGRSALGYMVTVEAGRCVLYFRSLNICMKTTLHKKSDILVHRRTEICRV